MHYDLEEFKEYHLYPALWERIDSAFPEMDFKFSSGYWKSSKHLNGTPSTKKDKTYIHFRMKHWIQENGGEGMSLIDFEMQRSGKDFIQALRSLSDLCGLTIPNSDNEQYKQNELLRKDREKANDIFKKALWNGSSEANEVLDYLMNVRKWTKKDIEDAELGYINTNIKEHLPIFQELADSSVGTTHRLTIPYRNGSRLLGFKFRDIHCTEGQKYRNSKGLHKSTGLFGIGIGIKDITIVEGELDALHAQVKGATNVTATTGNAASEEQIRDAIRRGAKRFTILFDNDEAGRKFTASTIETIERTGAEAYIASLPEGIKDTDEFLSIYDISEWKKCTEMSVPSYQWKYSQTLDHFSTLSESQGGFISMKQREDFFKDVESILNAPSMKPYNREVVYRLMENTEHETLFKVDDFRAFVDTAYIRQQERFKKENTILASNHIQELLNEGRTEEALKLMERTASEQKSKDKANEFAKVFAPSTPADTEKFLSEIKEGIPTGYKFYESGKPVERLTLNTGLTFICGYRGHGKTSFLNNIALNDAKRNIRLGNGKSVLYFSYEVDKRRLLADMLNTFVNDADISKTPLESIISYFKGNKQYFRNERRKEDGKTHLQYFEERKNVFLREYIGTGALTIVDENYKVGELLSAIKYFVATRSVSIVCIDYAQLIYSEDKSRMRTEEIKQVVNDIKDFANKEGIPFVLAAQFNREVDSPISVDTKNIGEGGDFERIADTCIGLFNLKELHHLPSNKSTEEKEALRLVSRLMNRQILEAEPIENRLFVRLMKRRYGYYPINTILEWEGRTKYIRQNSEEDMEPQQGELGIMEDIPF